MLHSTASFLIFLTLVIESTLSVFIPDPEFDNYDNWLNRNRSVIMRKNLPPKANTTWEKYYKSWGKDYDKEMATKELTTETAKFIDDKLAGYTGTKNFTLILNVHVSECSNAEELFTFQTIEKTENFKQIYPRFSWSAEYCGTEAISKWCDKGDRLKISLAANHTTAINTRFFTNVTFICPLSFYHLFLNTFRQETKESWVFTTTFYVTIGVIVGCLIFAISILAFVLWEKRNRKLSKMANNEHWRRFRFTNTYHSFDIPNFDFPMTGCDDIDETPSISNAEYVPIRK